MKINTKQNSNSNTIIIVISIIIASLIIGSAIYFSGSKQKSGQGVEEENVVNANNVSLVDGKQIIEITAKGGYRPVHSFAKAGIPTILRLDTSGTFDCTSILRIPSLNISQNLPISGTTDIDLGTQKANVLQGTCGMGMYPFDITFQ